MIKVPFFALNVERELQSNVRDVKRDCRPGQDSVINAARDWMKQPLKK
jgi:hypothetical protein